MRTRSVLIALFVGIATLVAHAVLAARFLRYEPRGVIWLHDGKDLPPHSPDGLNAYALVSGSVADLPTGWVIEDKFPRLHALVLALPEESWRSGSDVSFMIDEATKQELDRIQPNGFDGVIVSRPITLVRFQGR